MIATQAELAAAFTEWDRRYREEPERFQSEAEHLLRETPRTYGEACAPYLMAIVGQIQAAGRGLIQINGRLRPGQAERIESAVRAILFEEDA